MKHSHRFCFFIFFYVYITIFDALLTPITKVDLYQQVHIWCYV